MLFRSQGVYGLCLRVLADSEQYFPRYDAMLLYRLDMPKRFPAAWQALQKLEGRISESAMISMNAAVEIDGKSFAVVAREWLASGGGKPAASAARAGLLPIIVWLVVRSRHALPVGNGAPAAATLALRRPLSAWLLLSLLAVLAFIAARRFGWVL